MNTKLSIIFFHTQKVQKNLNIDDWENKRGPRAWEENFDISKQKLSQEKL